MITYKKLGMAALFLLGAGCATFNAGTPVPARVRVENDREVVFQAALGTLQEMGMELRAMDARNGTLKTKWIDSRIDSHTSLHYQILVSVIQAEPGKCDVEINLHGEKSHKLAGMSYSSSIDESDPDVKSIVQGILSATSDKVRGSLP